VRQGLPWKVGLSYVGFEVLTAVVMKSSAFWDIVSCSSLKVNQSFGGIPLTTCFMLVSWWLIFRPWGWRRHVPPKRRLTCNWLHEVVSKKIGLFNCSAEQEIPCFYVTGKRLHFQNYWLDYLVYQLNLQYVAHICRADMGHE
jgi:hypothetical protein